jgi:hypothetical protein
MSIKANFPSIRPSLLLDFANVKALDPRITFTRASTGTYFDEKGVLQTAVSGQARFDHNPTTLAPLGLLIEEQRTNSIRNNTMQGAVAGTPGTAPTNWAITSDANGIAREIIGTGVENGITYLDLKYSGTPTATATFAAVSEGTTIVVAANGQTWTGSAFVRLVGGSLTNVAVANSVFGRNSAGGALESTQTAITPTSAALSTQRFVTVRTMTNASTERVTQQIGIAYTNGAAIDITLRIGLPQLEQGAFATSVIPTTTAAATRNADAASMTGTNFSSWYRADEGTFFVDWTAGQDDVFINAWSVGSTVVNGGFMNMRRGNTGNLAASIIDGTVTQSGISVITGSPIAGTTYKAVSAYKVNDFAAVANGGAVGTDTSGTVPSTIGTLLIGNGWSNGGATAANEYLNSTIRKIAFYPTRLSNAQLQALTR